MSERFRIGITLGDPAGVGPEIVAKLLSVPGLPDCAKLVVLGGRGVLKQGLRAIGSDPAAAERTAMETIEGADPAGYRFGAIQAECGEAAYQALVRGIDMAKAGEIDALVTGPLHKQALHLAGHTYPGHTEILAERCGGVDVALMLVAGSFRVVHVTCHTALREVSESLTIERIQQVAHLFHNALVGLDGRAPRMVLCALNPHAGEGGLFGREELDVLAPGVERCRASGLNLSGPLPSDSVYPRHRAGEFDGVIALYHDQGHIAFKLVNFHVDRKTGEWTEVCGVNVTLGLPIVRTSVDHGTAFDIAGTGRASERSLCDAVEVAVQLARRRRRTTSG